MPLLPGIAAIPGDTRDSGVGKPLTRCTGSPAVVYSISRHTLYGICRLGEPGRLSADGAERSESGHRLSRTCERPPGVGVACHRTRSLPTALCHSSLPCPRRVPLDKPGETSRHPRSTTQYRRGSTTYAGVDDASTPPIGFPSWTGRSENATTPPAAALGSVVRNRSVNSGPDLRTEPGEPGGQRCITIPRRVGRTDERRCADDTAGETYVDSSWISFRDGKLGTDPDAVVESNRGG